MEYKDIVIDNDAIVNTAPEELPEEAHNIPQGVKPHLNPNPGYGEDGETKPAIKTEPVEGEIVKTPEYEVGGENPITPENRLINFIKGLLVKGKPLEEYIDSQGGVTEEELEDAIKNKIGFYEVANIENISESILDALKPGDVVVKITGNQKHSYVVSYKGSGAGQGICLTYVDGSGYMETISYDYTDEHWVYNSKDVCNINEVKGTKLYVHDLIYQAQSIRFITNSSGTPIFSGYYGNYYIIAGKPGTIGVTYPIIGVSQTGPSTYDISFADGTSYTGFDMSDVFENVSEL